MAEGPIFTTGPIQFGPDLSGTVDTQLYRPGGGPGILVIGTSAPGSVNGQLACGSLFNHTAQGMFIDLNAQSFMLLSNGGGSHYNYLSLNNSLSDATNIGFLGGATGDLNLYFEVPTTGKYEFLTSGVSSTTMAAALLNVLSGAVIGWSSSSSNSDTAADTGISRVAPAVIAFGNGTAGNNTAITTAKSYVAVGDSGGTVSTNTLTGTGSTTISTGVGSVKMSTANPGTNTGWLKCYVGTQVAWVPTWTTNAP